MKSPENTLNNNEQNEKLNENPENQESLESAEDMQKRLSQEMTGKNEELKQENAKIETANNSIGLSNEEVAEEKTAMNLDSEISSIDTEADKLTNESKEKINDNAESGETTPEEKLLDMIEIQSQEITIRPDDRNEKGELLVSPGGLVSKLSEQEWKIIRTQKFKEWSEGNKLVDESTGEPILLYHGSTKRFSEFDVEKVGSTTGDTSGIYLTDNKKIAKSYYSKETGNSFENLKLMFGLGKHKSSVYSCFAKSNNPFIYDFNNSVDTIGRAEIIAKAKQEGYDSVVLKNIIDGPSVVQNAYVVFNNKNALIEKVE